MNFMRFIAVYLILLGILILLIELVANGGSVIEWVVSVVMILLGLHVIRGVIGWPRGEK